MVIQGTTVFVAPGFLRSGRARTSLWAIATAEARCAAVRVGSFGAGGGVADLVTAGNPGGRDSFVVAGGGLATFLCSPQADASMTAAPTRMINRKTTRRLIPSDRR